MTPAARPPGLVHGMGTALVAATWPALEDAEVRGVLSAYRERLGPEVARAHVVWHSPRPMSSAALVEAGEATVFVKRHHPAVRTRASLRTEHLLAGHLRRRGVAVPEVLAKDDGSTVTETSGARYEVHARADGADLYAQVPSWRPYAHAAHAGAAGAALARFHAAAADFDAPPRPFGPLVTSLALAGAPDPSAALAGLLARRPALAGALDRLDAARGVARHCLPALARASRVLAPLPRRWAHGDWHPSNLTWSGGGPTSGVVGVLDLGLANRTAPLHDVAVAIERSCIGWLVDDGAPRVDLAAVDALLDGYAAVRPRAAADWRSLADVLPACHVEYALSEVEYFATVVGSEADAALAANDYLVGHCRYFEEGDGAALLEHLCARG
ncbi:MAG: phosphotransferase enzyme family protein [Acidimicrobiales bacterium]